MAKNRKGNGKGGKDDEPRDKEAPHRQIVPAAEGVARDIFEWLEKQFKLSPNDAQPNGEVKSMPDNFPERIVLCPLVGDGGDGARGTPLETKSWKPMESPQPSREKLIELANLFYGLAMRWCANNRRRLHRFVLLAYSNLKGPDAYATLPFTARAGVKEYDEAKVREVLASDDENTHRDRLLETSLEDKRWTMETGIGALVAAQKAGQSVNQMLLQIVQEQRTTISQMEADRRAWILAVEEAESKKSERKIKEERSQVLNTVLTDAWSSVKGLLPGIVAYATKGKAGIVEGVRLFIEGLTEEQKISLFGRWNEGELIDQGILKKEQIEIIVGIADKKVDPLRIKDLAVDLEEEQMVRAQEVLKPAQIQSLLALVKAASSVSEANGA